MGWRCLEMERASAEPLAASPARERCIDRAAEQRLVLCQSRGSHGMVWMLRVALPYLAS